MLEKKLRENKIIVDAALYEALSVARIGRGCVADAMQYAVLSGGKRLRAFLVRHFAAVYGGAQDAALPFAVAVELGHTASLIHDDLPCMDSADLRHGKDTCHVRFGEDIAVLTGDALLMMAFELANGNPHVSAEVARYAVKTFAEKAGVKGMCLGQEQDLLKTCKNEDELLILYDLKTGRSLQAAAILGYLTKNEIPSDLCVTKITEYAQLLGRIFQITDDILDATKTEEETGKSKGMDAKNGTKTIFSFMSLEQAQVIVEKMARQAALLFDDEILSQLPFYLTHREK